MKTVILVPRRAGIPERDQIWAWVRAWWQTAQPEWEMIEGHHEGGLFNRAAAINRAAAGEWDMAVIIDADVICDPDQVRAGVELASESGSMVLPFNVRYDLNLIGSRMVMDGYQGDWHRFTRRRFRDMCSGVVIVTRKLWDQVGGFDETFEGWGWEDNAFWAACETFAGPMVKLPGEMWHLFHADQPRPTVLRNKAHAQRYFDVKGDPQAMAELRAGGIPRIFHRVVPEATSDETEQWWTSLQALHPGWSFLTHRDPLQPEEWPMTAKHWRYCRNGASLADLVRLEALWKWGGIYLDSDVQPFRSFEPLRPLSAFAAWEDAKVVPNAVLGARRKHPAIKACLDLALREVKKGTWQAGPGVTTKILPGRDDVLLLPPGSFYPYHYTEKQRRGEDHMKAQPWAFGAHHWNGSWLEQKAG